MKWKLLPYWMCKPEDGIHCGNQEACHSLGTMALADNTFPVDDAGLRGLDNSGCCRGILDTHVLRRKNQ